MYSQHARVLLSALKEMNNYTVVIRTDRGLHERIRKLAYMANTSRSAAIRKLLNSQEEEAQLRILMK